MRNRGLVGGLVVLLCLSGWASGGASEPSWRVHPIPTTETLHELIFRDQLAWALSHQGGRLLASVDGGHTWELRAELGAGYFEAMLFADDRRGWASGERGRLLATSDGGRSWRGVGPSLPESAWIYGLFAPDSGGDGPLLAVGLDAETWNPLLLRSETGDTWVEGGIPEGSAYEATLRAGDGAWLLGGTEILRSTDQGATWTVTEADMDRVVRALAKVPGSDRLWAAGQPALLITSEDHGRSWSAAPGPEVRILRDILFLDPETGYLGGDGEPGLWLTTDGGATWRSAGVDGLASVHRLRVHQGRLWAAGRMEGGGVLVSRALSDEGPLEPPLWGSLRPGDHAVGFRSENKSGTTLDVWYPAVPGGAPRLTFGDYVRHELGEDLEEEELHRWLSVAVSGDAAVVSKGLAREILGGAMQARTGAEPAPGPFPLVVWTARHETTSAQAVLSEYLASQGYVVVSSRTAGPRHPYPWEIQEAGAKREVFAALLGHLETAITALADDPAVDSDRIGVLTWSYAAEMAPVLQLRHDAVAVVVGLSSNPLATAGLYHPDGVLTGMPASDLDAAYVVMTEAVGTDGTEREPPPLLGELPSASYFVRFRELAHGNFNGLEGMIPGVYRIEQVQPWSRGGLEARQGYETIARYVLAFLDLTLKPSPSTGARGRPWESESPGGAVETIQFGGAG